MTDRTITCCEPDCGAQFIFTLEEQKFFSRNGFTPPKRCKACRDRKKVPPIRILGR